MVTRRCQIAEKYKWLRLQPDPTYDSLTFKTFFNKFTKEGKKATATRHTHSALIYHRMIAPVNSIYHTIMEHIRALTHKIKLVLVRKGAQFHEVPVPPTRLKSTVAALHEIYKAIVARTGRTIRERILEEISDVTLNVQNSSALRRVSEFYRLVFDSRVHLEKRWK